MFGRSTLELCYIILAEDGRIWLDVGAWGSPEGNDMCDSKVFLSRKQAERVARTLDARSTVYEIGLYNGRPVMLVDAYEYWLDANYYPKRKS